MGMIWVGKHPLFSETPNSGPTAAPFWTLQTPRRGRRIGRARRARPGTERGAKWLGCKRGKWGGFWPLGGMAWIGL